MPRYLHGDSARPTSRPRRRALPSNTLTRPEKLAGPGLIAHPARGSGERQLENVSARRRPAAVIQSATKWTLSDSHPAPSANGAGFGSTDEIAVSSHADAQLGSHSDPML